ncbi:MAG TPA: hypothetical protein VGR29_08150 [Thermomicrobiales bacterium]|nr:hypothetical protein [Thermomicrobiales bacterium]
MPSPRDRSIPLHVIIRYWRVSLGMGLVVIGAVALLLDTLAKTTTRIEAGAGEIWRVGKLIANNTVHVPLLVRTNQITADILPVVDGIASETMRIGRAVVGDANA